MSEHVDEQRPQTREGLKQWIQDHLDITIGETPMVPGHAAPMDYLAHAFFEGRVPDCDGVVQAKPADCVLWACRGGGKTFLGAVATVLDLVFKPGIQIRLLGGSLEQSQRMHEHLRRLFEAPLLAGQVEGKITARRVRLTNGSSAEVLAASQTSVRGVRVQKVRCDEVDLFSPEMWAAAQLTTRSGRFGDIRVPGVIECLSTMHRPYGMMRDIVREATEGRRTLFRWGVLDVLERCGDEHECESEADGPCPLLVECEGRAKDRQRDGHIPVGDAITLKGRVSLATWDSEMLCRRPSTSHLVLPEFDAAVHVREAPAEQAGWMYVGGMDFGFRAPAVVLWGAVDPEGRLWILAERSVRACTLEAHIRAMRAAPWPRPAWLGVDPAGSAVSGQTGQSDIQRLQAAGFDVRWRASRLRDGLELIRARLRPADGEPRLFISPRCATLIRSMESYHYDERNLDAETPVKDGADHAVDALRYLVLNLDRRYRTKRGDYLEWS
ncbi:MAG: hypothetical protein ACF8R7_00525 [Phycisphaerales bacterium JB039]